MNKDDYIHLDVAAKRIYVQDFEHEEPYPQLHGGMVLCNEDKVLQVGAGAGSSSRARYCSLCIVNDSVKSQEEDKLKRWHYVEESAGQSKTRRYR